MMLKVIWILMLAGVVNGQIKIGDIQITERIAKEYFLDCYLNPDTVRIYAFEGLKFKSEPDWYDDYGNRYYNLESIKKKFPMGEVYVTYKSVRKKWRDRLWLAYLKARTPSESDFAEWFRKREVK